MNAAAPLDAAQTAFGLSLPIATVPAKLRCGSCNRLAVNTVKLPCCDQNICEPCSQDLPDDCPICSHSPISAEDCNPNKSMRTTIRAFVLGAQEKAKTKNAELQAPQAAAATPAASTPTPAPISAAAAAEIVPDVPSARNGPINGESTTATPSDAKQSADDAHKNIELTPSIPDVSHGVQADEEDEEEYEEDEDDQVVITTERPDDNEQQYHQQSHQSHQAEGTPQVNGVQEKELAQSQYNHQPQDFNYAQNQNFGGGMDFNNMNFGAMMAMQNGMGMPNFAAMGMPNMMGMPGMNMDPSMMFNGGFGGMGGMNMNDMSNMMNMGMGALNGMGNFGGMPGMGNGMNFFPPNGNMGGGGYNNSQQNFGASPMMNNPPFHHQNNRGFGGRGQFNNRGAFGRGRGGYYNRGRGGGWQQQQQNHYGQYQNQGPNANMPNHQPQQNFGGNNESGDGSTQQGATRGSPSYEPMTPPDGAVSEGNLQKPPACEEPTGAANAAEDETTDDTGHAATEINATNGEDSTTELANGHVNEDGEKVTLPNAVDDPTSGDSLVVQSVAVPVSSIEDEHVTINGAAQASNGHQYQQGLRSGPGNFRGRGGAYGYVVAPAEGSEPVRPATPPINAPTGPKAMRSGFPNNGRYSRQHPQSAPLVVASSIDPHERPRTANRDARGRSRSRSPRRSVNGEREDRLRSPSKRDESRDDYERREKRKRKDRGDERSDENSKHDEDEKSRKKIRSRSESRDDGHSSRRRHRDRDHDKEDDETRHSSRSQRDKSRERRRHRHRSRSPEREGSVNGEHDSSSRRKSKSERKRDDDYEDSDRAKDRYARKHSRRGEEEYESRSKDRSSSRHRHGHSSSRREDKYRERESSKRHHRSGEEVQEEEEVGFKIKGKSASMKQQQHSLETNNNNNNASMRPPSTFKSATTDKHDQRRSSSGQQNASPHAAATDSIPTVDIYAADRERARRNREDMHAKRRQSSQGLGKRSRDDDEHDGGVEGGAAEGGGAAVIPTGPRGDVGHGGAGKRARKSDGRRHSLKFEGEIGEGLEEREREGRRYR